MHERARQYVEAGQALTVYLGHSNPAGFYANRARFLDREDWTTMKIARGPGIFATFGCNGCQLRGNDGEGYGVAAIRNPNPAILTLEDRVFPPAERHPAPAAPAHPGEYGGHR